MGRPRKPRVDAGLGLPAPTAARQELWEGIAATLRDAILDGRVPAGASLVEADLAARFGVSRGPVRDALRELARQGLAVDLPRRGTVVSTISLRDLQEVYEVREGLEIAAVRLAAARATEDQLAAVQAAIEALEAAWRRGVDYPESLALDLEVHRLLVDIPGNARLSETNAQMLVQTRLHAITAAVLNPRLRRGMRREVHRAILRALVRRDADAASAAVVAHYAYARERLLAGLRGEP